MLGAIVKLLRVASIVVCAIVVLAFIVFAANQTKTASGHQQNELQASNGEAESHKAPTHESGIHKALEEASSKLTSPFAGVVSDSSSEWAEHGVRLLLALLVYGFGLGFLARTLRVRM